MKKLMALVLAVATAVSMFATSAFAVNFEDGVEYTGGYIAADLEFGTDEIKVKQEIVKEDGTTEVLESVIKTSSQLKGFVEKLELGDPVDAPEDFSAYIALNKGEATDKFGAIYMYDYLKDKTSVNDRTYENNMANFADLVDEILSARTQELSNYDVEDFIRAWGKAYETTKNSSDVIDVRYATIADLRANQRTAKKFFSATTGNFDEDLFDAEDVADYAAEKLFTAVKDANWASMATSEIIYLNAEFERVLEEINYAEVTNDQDAYYEALDKVTSYVEEDFTAAGWREVQELLAEAEEIAAEAVSIYDWQEATMVLEEAMAVRGKAVDYTDLQEALIDLFVGDGKTSDIKPDNGVYAGDDDDVYVYNVNDYKVRGRVSQEWADFAGEDANGNVDGEPAAFTEAYAIYKKVRASATAYYKQSEVDEALENLIDAVDALVSNADSVDEWVIVKLQSAVDAAEALVESDYNTTSRKWEALQDDIADAKEVLAKANPTKAEVDRVTEALIGEREGDTDGTLYAIMVNPKSTSSAKEKELKELMRKADRLVNNITTQTGAQVAALRDAADAAYEVNKNLSTPAKAWEKTTISQLDAAIADLTAAIDSFNNPQGWYKEDGKWFYGVGAEVYADGWAQIGETWYMFNADGSLKMSEWFQVEGKWYWANENGGLAVGWAKVDGKWYFFDQGNAMKTGWVKADNNWYYLASSGAMVTGWNWIGGNCYYFYNNGAMAANTTIGGYTVDANGAWVK